MYGTMKISFFVFSISDGFSFFYREKISMNADRYNTDRLLKKQKDKISVLGFSFIV